MFDAGGAGCIEDYEMASQAVIDMSCPRLQQPLVGFESEIILPVILSADSIPALRESRQAARSDGKDIVEFNRILQTGGYESQVPLVVDPLGTAELVLRMEAEFGEGSPEHLDSLEALRLDTRRLVGEAKRKLTWEDYPVAVQAYDADNNDFLSHGVSLSGLTYNGLSPNSVAEKEATRIEDWVEEKGTYQAIGRQLMGSQVDLVLLPEEDGREEAYKPDSISATRFSLCPDWAIKQYKDNTDSGGAFEGFVPEIEKFVIRNLKFDAKNKCRYESQLAVPGLFIDTQVMAEAINLLDSNVSLDATKQEINGTVMVTEEDIDEWDWIELLDAIASERHGIEIFMGEVYEGEVKDYALAKSQSKERYTALETDTDILSSSILNLAKAGVDSVAAGGLIESKLKDMMLAECNISPAKARVMFNEETAIGLEKANSLESLGRITDAINLRLIVAEQAPQISFCGAGSCGLDNVSQFEIDSDKRLSGLIENGDIVLKDVERKCACGMKSIIYVFNDKKVVKYCTTCKREEKTAGKNYGSDKQQD